MARKYLGHLLLFAGACLLLTAGLSAAGWALCVQRHGTEPCRPDLATAVAALSGAATSALGIAVKTQ